MGKYYHPLIAPGKLNWDSVFVNNMQDVIDAKNANNFNNLLSQIINSVGKPQKTKLQKNRIVYLH